MRDRQPSRKARRRGAPGTGMSTAVGLTVLIAALLILVARSQPHGQGSAGPSETRVISVPTMPPPAPATVTTAPAPTVAPAPPPTDTARPILAPPTATAEAVLTGTASIESIAVQTVPAAPAQLQVLVKGYLPDACTTVDQITQARNGDTLQITITTARPLDKACVQTVVPFEKTVALDVTGLPPGTYTVRVNSARATFTLPAATPRP